MGRRAEERGERSPRAICSHHVTLARVEDRARHNGAGRPPLPGGIKLVRRVSRALEELEPEDLPRGALRKHLEPQEVELLPTKLERLGAFVGRVQEELAAIEVPAPQGGAS